MIAVTVEEAQAAARAQLEEQTRQAQERARIADKAAEDAKYEADCLAAARR